MSTPSMRTHIKRHRLYATVTITNRAGQRLVTALNRDVLISDPRIDNLKRGFAHVPQIVESTI